MATGIQQQITAMPTPPDPAVDDNSSYPAKATAFTQAIVTLVGQLNTFAAQANALNVGAVFGERYTYLSDVAAADPGAGKLKFDNASLNLATKLYISETDADANNKGAILATWDDNIQALKGLLRLVKASNPAVYADFAVSGSLTDNGAWDTFTVNYVGGAGVIANNDNVVLQFQRYGADGSSAVFTAPTRIVSANGSLTYADNGYYIVASAPGVTLTCDTPAAMSGSSIFFNATQHGVLVTGTFANVDGTVAASTKAVPRGSAAVLSSDGTGLRLELVPPTNVYQLVQNAAYTLGLVDQGVDVTHTDGTARAYLIPANAAVAFPIGTVVMFTNAGTAGNVTISCNDTLTWAGSGTAGPRTLGIKGIATAKKVAATEWYITGAGLT